MDWTIELVVVPVTDIDRARRTLESRRVSALSGREPATTYPRASLRDPCAAGGPGFGVNVGGGPPD